MELSEFIQKTLMQIIKGIHSCQEPAKEHGAFINPRNIETKGGPYLMQSWIKNEAYIVQNVDFEIGLTATASEASKSGIGVLLGGIIGGSTNVSTDDKSGSVTNIKFRIPVIFPSFENQNENIPLPSQPNYRKNRF